MNNDNYIKIYLESLNINNKRKSNTIKKQKYIKNNLIIQNTRKKIKNRLLNKYIILQDNQPPKQIECKIDILSKISGRAKRKI